MMAQSYLAAAQVAARASAHLITVFVHAAGLHSHWKEKNETLVTAFYSYAHHFANE
jgi:hypothetical protein